MLRTGEAIAAVQAFLNAYLIRRDPEKALECLTEDVYWIGTGRSEPIRGREEAREALSSGFGAAPALCEITYDAVEEKIIAERGGVALLTARVSSGAGGSRLLVSAACAECGDGVCRIASIHASAPDGWRDSGANFSSSCPEQPELERQIAPEMLDILGKNIPGGMMGGYLEPGFPLYYINDRLLSCLGFTYREFVAATAGMVLNCMHPDDRERVNDMVKKAFWRDQDYEIQYRMLKKNGRYIWVNDIGKKGCSADGRAVCLSVIRDISSEVEARERLESQAEEQRQLAAQYDHLFQSVLCGIVQYRFIDQGIVFKKANREAIRIFGYTPEEFWAKKDWNMADLVAEEDRRRILEDVKKPHRPGDRGSYEYRLLQRDGTSCWVVGTAEVFIDSDGDQIIQSVYLDIDDRKKAELRNRRLTEQIEASNKILHLALEHTSTCEFYYYPETGECVVPERTQDIYHSREHYEDMPRSYALEQVDKAFYPVFYDMYDRIHRGERTASCEFLGTDGRFWCRETLSVILSGADGAPQFVVGIVENITRQKEAEEALEEARSRDSLTGLYNAESGIRLAQEYLLRRKAPDEECALMLLDMDDFENINRREGGIFADAILQEVSDVLRAQTRPEDILVRMGGDEFMLLLKRCDKGRAAGIGPRIAAAVQNILINAQDDVRASVSVGICGTEVAEEYHALYRCAESTLKYVKENGKGRAASYQDTSNELGVFLTQLYAGAHPLTAIDRSSSYDKKDLLSFALDLLGKSKNLDDAVYLLLSRIGKTLHFDRVSIIEADHAFLTYRFSYQWARSRADIQLGEDFYVSEEDFAACSNMYDADGLADHNLHAGISRIASCLHAGIWNYGEYVGSMSFEVDREDYPWSKEERDFLKELVKIVSSFLMKSRADAVSRAKTDFLSRMSHEIRTPMNAISGMTTIAKSVVDDRKKLLDCLEKIESADAYLLSLINDVLDMSRIESGKLELSLGPTDLSRQLSNLESMFRSQALEKRLSLQFIDDRCENRPLSADSLRLNQVLVNILGNAIKFTERGGVTVRVEEVKAEPRAALRFSVADTGIGIEPAARQRIFNAFEQAEAGTSSRHGGTGLGLSISSRLVQMMGGALEVRSEVGKGSVFFFTLTFDYAQEMPAAGEENPAASHPDFHGKHLLLAEDNELNREIAQTLLEMNGLTVACAADGQEALELFCAAEPGEFDAILMDIRMPVMDGLEATRRIRTCGHPDARTVPIIALTANAFDEDTKKSLSSGMNGHLSKPLQMDQMLELLGRCMG